MRYPWAVPGAKVVCVDDSIGSAGPPPNGYEWMGKVEVKSGKTYTVQSVQINPLTNRPCISLVEVPSRGDLDFGYWVARFRPLHTQETDVALFANLLTPSPNSPMLPTKELTHQ